MLLANYMALGNLLKFPDIAGPHWRLGLMISVKTLNSRVFHEKSECSYLQNSKNYSTYHIGWYED